MYKKEASELSSHMGGGGELRKTMGTKEGGVGRGGVHGVVYRK